MSAKDPAPDSERRLTEAIAVDRPAGIRLVLPFVVAIAIGAVVLKLLARPTNASQIEACRFVMAEELDRQTKTWRARARGEEPPPLPEDDDVEARDVFAACAPLYSDAACRAARSPGKGTDVRPSERLQNMVQACRAAYCPRLSPRPTLCEVDDARLGREGLALFQELDDAILRLELGARAEPILELRKSGARELQAAMLEYLDAGSPEFAGGSGRVKMRLSPGRIETRLVGDAGP